MKALAASIVILAGSIMFSGGVVTHGGNSDGGLIGGIIVGLFGAGLLLREMFQSGDSQK